MKDLSETETLTALRQEIDSIDREAVALFCRRMDVAERVAAYKKQNGLPVRDAAREDALLTKVADLAEEKYADACVALYREILALSRAYQKKIINEK